MLAVDEQHPHLARHAQGLAHGGDRGAIKTFQADQDRTAARIRGRVQRGVGPSSGGIRQAGEVEGLIQQAITTADPAEAEHQQRDQQHHQPGPGAELADDDDQQHQGGEQGAAAVHQGPLAPHRPPVAQPVAHHAGLGEAEGQKHPDGIEIDRHRGVATAEHDDQSCQANQHQDAVLEHQPVAAEGQQPRQMTIHRQQGAEAGEIGEGGVGRQHQDQQGGQLQHRIEGIPRPEDALAEDRHAGLAGGGIDPVHPGQQADADEHQRENHSHRRHRGPGVRVRGFAEHLDAVGDRLDAGHGRTARGKSPQDQKQAERGHGLHRWHRVGMEAVPQHQIHQPEAHQQRHHGDEGIDGQGEQPARFAQAPQIDPAHQHQQHQGDRHLPGQQGRQVGGEGLGAGHQAHGRRQRVVDQQG